MYLVAVLLASDAADAGSARAATERKLHDLALHVGDARRLTQIAIATAEFELRVYANRIELPRSHTAAGSATPPHTATPEVAPP